MIKFKFLSILALLCITASSAWAWSGSGNSADDPYLIQSADDWGTLADNVTNGTSYSGKFFKLTQNITATKCMAYGNADKYFSGTFDGGGFTITYSASVTYDYISLFRKCDGATIKNLHVTGTLTATHRYAAGIVADAKGNVTLINCRSSITINSSYNGDATHGGLVGCVSATDANITLRGCVFDGKFTTSNGTTNCGGLVGWSNSTLTVENCLFAPASGNTTSMGSGTLVRIRDGVASTYTNSYYTETFGTAQGKQARTISAGTDVTALAISGTATEYGAARITTYGTDKGFKYNGTYYAGNGDEVTLTLSHADKDGYTFSQYTATPGTLSGTTLTMTDADQTVSAQYNAIPTHSATWDATDSEKDDWSIEPGTPYEGQAVKATYNFAKGGKHVKRVKYTVKPVATMQTVTAAHVGKVIAANGNVYNTVAEATAAGTTASGIIAYVGTAGEVHSVYTAHKGIAVSLDETLLAYSTVNEDLDSPTSDFATVLTWKNGELTTNAAVAKGTYPAFTWAAGHNTTPGRVSGASAWFLPSVGQWNLAVRGMTGSNTDLKEGSSNANSNMDRDKLNVVLNAAGASPLGVGNYMMATEYSTTEFWEYIYLGYFDHMGKSAEFAVRPIFTF